LVASWISRPLLARRRVAVRLTLLLLLHPLLPATAGELRWC
jgi:hypothetical protein